MSKSTHCRSFQRWNKNRQEVKVIWQKVPHGGPIPRLGVTPGGRNLYHWIPGVWVPIIVFHSNYRPRMHRLATVHTRDNQPTTNDQRCHDTAYLNKPLFYYSKVRRLKIKQHRWQKYTFRLTGPRKPSNPVRTNAMSPNGRPSLWTGLTCIEHMCNSNRRCIMHQLQKDLWYTTVTAEKM